jgi:hypothetical protein
MALFKPKALPVVLEDITNTLHRAGRNSATAVVLLHDFVSQDPPELKIDTFVSALSRDVFRLREDCYPAEGISKLLARTTETRGGVHAPSYWAIYAYLFSLLPALIEQPRVSGERWNPDEYSQLVRACFTHWCNAHDKESDRAIFAGYNRVREATTAWFWRQSKLTTALEWCASAAVERILVDCPGQNGSVREKGFRFAVEELISSLFASFKADLAQYYLGARGFGFFATDLAPLPPHIDRE